MERYESIQKEFDKHRVDEWHSVIPLSEDGASLLEDLEEESYPNRLTGTNGLFLHQNEQFVIKPKEAYTTEAYGLMLEDNDYIYNIFMVSGGCDHHEGHLAQITRHDKQKHTVTREQWENSYTCG